MMSYRILKMCCIKMVGYVQDGESLLVWGCVLLRCMIACVILFVVGEEDFDLIAQVLVVCEASCEVKYDQAAWMGEPGA